MSAKGTGPGRTPDRGNPREGTGWSVMSYLIGGMALYGGIGWLIGRWTHISVLFPIGMLLGIGLALALILFRFAKP
jgi:F0F1-type ATP synthase assembly protein I